MFKTNFYTGEMSSEQYISEAEAVQNASFGQYAANQQSYIPPTYGLGGNVYQNSYNGPPYMQPPTGYQSYGSYNPALEYKANYGYPNQQQQFSQVFIPPINLSGNEYLFPSNIEDIAGDMVMKYYQEEAEYQGKRIAEQNRMRRQNYSYNGMQNYYGAPVYGTLYNNFHSSVQDELEELKKQAKEQRVELSKKLSRLAHNYLNDGVGEEQIKDIYEGRVINVENTVYQFSEMEAFQARFSSDRLVPLDPSQTPYREYVDARKKQIESILPKDTTVEEFGERMNLLMSTWELEELRDKRRNFGATYDNTTYKRLLRDRIAEKEANKSGFSLFDGNSEPKIVSEINKTIDNLQAMKSNELSPEEKTKAAKELASMLGYDMISEAVHFDEEGNMCLSANIGNHKGEMYTVKNENEAKFANQRAKFLAFEDSIPNGDRYKDEKYNQYKQYTESEFMFNITHPPSSGGDSS